MTEELANGTYRDLRTICWADFADEHVANVPGKANTVEAKYTLRVFAEACNPVGPHGVTYRMIELFNRHLREKGNAVATRNKRLRYLRAALNLAVKRGYVKVSPMDSWEWEREDNKAPKILTLDEETAILKAADSLYGFRWWCFLYIALRTGARLGELLSLAWDHVDFDEARMHLTQTKGKRDRMVPLTPDSVNMLRRLIAQTLKQGGPFIGLGTNINRAWRRIRNKAGMPGVTIHDLRRTFITRALRSGADVDIVRRLAGHSSLSTTMTYYTWANDAELRDAVKKMERAVG